MNLNRLRSALAAGVLITCAAWPALASNAVTEESARQTLAELRVLVTEGTNVIGDMQPMINSGKVDSQQVTPEALERRLLERYQKVAGRGLDVSGTGLPAQTRKAYVDAYRQIITQYRSVIAEGGQDAFVPAYFRALVLTEFNKAMGGQVRAYATNRDHELINGDWSVSRVMRGSPLAGEVGSLMNGGSLEPVVKRSGDRMLGYWPMKLGASCVACHAANGMKQREGAFGGALVAEVPVR
jgi:hypothetical protein